MPDPGCWHDVRALYARLHETGDTMALEAAADMGRQARATGTQVVVVSACLLGGPTRYDGGARYVPEIVEPLAQDPSRLLLPLCPEVLGGMGCPRAPVAFACGDGDALLDGREARVLTPDGTDRTAELRQGAERAEALARAAGATEALLKERSPSCGVHRIHGPHGLQSGKGAFAARLARLGLIVRSEADSIGPDAS